MNKLMLKCVICISFVLMLCSCTNQSNPFYVISDYDYFRDAGDMGFYKAGEQYGFIRLNGDATGLKPFALDKEVSDAIDFEGIQCFNGFATFSTKEGVLPQQHGFMDLHGNVSMKSEWEQIRAFSSSGYTSVFDSELNRYIIIDKAGKTIRDNQSYIEFYYPDSDIFICNDTSDEANSKYYILDKDLNVLLDDLQVYYRSGKEMAHIRQYTIFGDGEKFIFKKNNKFYLYSLKSKKIISEFDNFDDLLKKQTEFIEGCQKAYANYEYPSPTDRVNGIVIHYDENTDRYSINNENGKILLEPDPDITGLTYRKGKVIQGISKSTGKTVVIFNKNYK